MSGGGVSMIPLKVAISLIDVLNLELTTTNELVYVDFKGDEVIPYLTAVANMKPDAGAYGQFYNVNLTLNKDGTISDVKIDGKLCDPAENVSYGNVEF
ncbi:hypothetical protein [Providencia hangzhouensis]|uniref:hypothetical protein n=1 Tax=Providencia hangzhouensis TaxID=3031799 RepID=UPI003F68DAB8